MFPWSLFHFFLSSVINFPLTGPDKLFLLEAKAGGYVSVRTVCTE